MPNVEAVNARLGRVLVVEDDPGIATQLVRGLTRAGYETGSVTTGKAALDWPVPDVVLLDLGLPDIDGVEVCRRLRQACDAAIIIVTARGEESDRVLALDEGADDYLIKPFGLQELLARIRAVLRRSRQPAGQVLQHGPLTVDLRTHKVTVGGNHIAVTPKEFAILECLASDPGRVVSRQEMLERAWDEHWYGPTKVLDVHMAALRKKLGDPGLIETVYGHGFRLADQAARRDQADTPGPAGLYRRHHRRGHGPAGAEHDLARPELVHPGDRGHGQHRRRGRPGPPGNWRPIRAADRDAQPGAGGRLRPADRAQHTESRHGQVGGQSGHAARQLGAAGRRGGRAGAGSRPRRASRSSRSPDHG